MADYWLKFKMYKDQTKDAANILTIPCQSIYYKENGQFDRSEAVDTVEVAINSILNTINKKLSDPRTTTDYYN